MTDLPPCPYCAGRDVTMGEVCIATTPPSGAGRYFFVACDFCGCETGLRPTREAAAEVWCQVPADFSGKGKSALRFPRRDPSDLH